MYETFEIFKGRHTYGAGLDTLVMSGPAGEGFKLGMPSADLLLVVLSIVIKVPFVQVLVVAVVVRLSYRKPA